MSPVAMELPEARIATAGPTKLYPKRSQQSEIAAASGFPVKRVKLSEARKRARDEDRGR